MTSPLAGLTDLGQLHLLTLRASGRVPDAVSIEMREALATGRPEECARMIARAGFPLAADEIAALSGYTAELPSPSDVIDEPTSALFVAVPPATLGEYGDVPPPPLLDSTADPAGVDGYDALVFDALDLSETAGVWRTWRIDIDDQGNASAVRVYVIEADVEASELPVVAWDVQNAVREEGFLIEVYRPGLPLPSYQWAARSSSALIWAPYPAPEIHIASPAGPGVALDESEYAPALDYLRSAALLTPELASDGWWVWPVAFADRVESEGVLTDPELLTHLRSVGFALWEVDAVAAHRAVVALRNHHEVVDDLPPGWE